MAKFELYEVWAKRWGGFVGEVNSLDGLKSIDQVASLIELVKAKTFHAKLRGDGGYDVFCTTSTMDSFLVGRLGCKVDWMVCDIPKRWK